MNTIKSAPILLAAIGLSVAGCDQSREEAVGDLAEQEVESEADVLEEQADVAEATGDEAAEEALDDRADALNDAAGDAGAAAEDRAATQAEQ